LCHRCRRGGGRGSGSAPGAGAWGVGDVDDAEAVEAWLDFEEGADLAVDEDAVGGELGDTEVFGVAGGVVEKLAVGGEIAVIEDEGISYLPLGR
jgi:hypothetical protein